MRWLARVALLVTLAGFAGAILVGTCHAQQVAVAPTVTSYAPPPVYRAWYAHMLACSGVVHPAAPFDSLHFLSVTDTAFAAEGQVRRYIAYTYPGDRTIVVIRDSLYAERVVSHELLHAILGKPGHGPMFQMCGVWLGDANRSWPTNAVEDSTHE